MEHCDVAIVGAGPYGLSAAAHLAGIKGLEVRQFGQPMSFWEQHMPEGMFLRSPWDGSHIAHPDNRFTLDEYRSITADTKLDDPIPLQHFVTYGRWFEREAGLTSDHRPVTKLSLAPKGYSLTLDDGERIRALRVVVAAGILPFAYRPEEFADLPASLVTHSSEHREFGRFRGKEVLVVGGGQSAIETAALLQEAGAAVQVLVRKPSIRWLGRHQWLQARGVAWLFYGRGGIGQAGVSLIVQRPSLFRLLPRGLQDHWGARAMRPAGAGWLRPRVHDVTFHLGRFAKSVRVESQRLHVRLDDGTDRYVDHVILGTGYRVNVARYPFLAPELLRHIRLMNGYPRLDEGFQASLPGIYFLGAPAAWSFGPLMKFVAGTEFAARRVSEKIAGAVTNHVSSQPARALQPIVLEARTRKSHG